jgi:hypothetical protein
MAEFEKVRGQIEGLWNVEVKGAELEGRKAGAAAAVEAVWQAGARLAGEWDEERMPHQTYKSFLQELRQRVGGAPALLLSPEEWERVQRALEPRPVFGRPNFNVEEPMLDIAPGIDERQGFRVGDVAAPLPDADPGLGEVAQAPEDAADAEQRRELERQEEESLAAQERATL